jgi:hypothetical protein
MVEFHSISDGKQMSSRISNQNDAANKSFDTGRPAAVLRFAAVRRAGRLSTPTLDRRFHFGRRFTYPL